MVSIYAYDMTCTWRSEDSVQEMALCLSSGGLGVETKSQDFSGAVLPALDPGSRVCSGLCVEAPSSGAPPPALWALGLDWSH